MVKEMICIDDLSKGVSINSRYTRDLSQKLRAFSLDIAVDLAGWTKGMVLQYFSERIAPIQVTFVFVELPLSLVLLPLLPLPLLLLLLLLLIQVLLLLLRKLLSY